MKVHIFCSDILSSQQIPLKSGGVRSMQYIRGLEQAGIEVSYSIPEESEGPTQVVSKTEHSYSSSNQIEILEKIAPDIAIFLSLSLFNLPTHYTTSCRLIVDLHESINFEFSQAKQSDESKKGENAIKKLAQFDSLVCASERQRWYWLGQCLSAGIPKESLHIEILPPALQENNLERQLSEEPTFIYASGFQPEQNVVKQLSAFAEVLENFGIGKLKVYGKADSSLAECEDLEKQRQTLSQYASVELIGQNSYSTILEAQKDAWCAIELTEHSTEQELALSTNSIEFLSNGVPLVYNNFSTLSEQLEAFEAGWCINSSSTSAIKSLAEKLLDTPIEEYKSSSESAKRLVQLKYSNKQSEKIISKLCSHKEKRQDRLPCKSLAQIAIDSKARVLILSEEENKNSVQRVIDVLANLCQQGLLAGYTLADSQLASGPHFFEAYDIIIAHGYLGPIKTSALLRSKTPFIRDIYPSEKFLSATKKDTASEVALATRATAIIHPSEESSVWYSKRFCTSEKKSHIIPEATDTTQHQLTNTKESYSGLLLFGDDLVSLGKLQSEFCSCINEISEKSSLPIFVVDQSGKSNGLVISELLPTARYSADVNRWQLYFQLASQPRLLAVLPCEEMSQSKQNKQETVEQKVIKQTKFQTRLALLRQHNCSIVFSEKLNSNISLRNCEKETKDNAISWKNQIEALLNQTELSVDEIETPKLSTVAKEQWHPLLRQATRSTALPYQTFTFPDDSLAEKAAETA